MKQDFFTAHTKVFFGLSAAIILAALVMTLFGFGMNLGIDFTGGSLLSYSVGESFDTRDVEQLLNEVGYTENQITKAAPSEASLALIEQMKQDGSYTAPTASAEDDGMHDLQIRLKVKADEEGTTTVRAHLEAGMREKYPNFRFVSIEHVSATAGSDLLQNAVKSLAVVFALLLVYIAIRFNFYSGLATLLALLHDVLIMWAFMVFFRGVYQVNSPFIAAVLTIVGYSINDTIVVFDRIRETAKRPDAEERSHRDIVGESVSRTFSRSVNTSVTTLITLVALYVFGVPSIREFAFPLIIGMLAGTYSSVLLSGQFWAMLMDRRAAKKKLQAENAPEANAVSAGEPGYDLYFDPEADGIFVDADWDEDEEEEDEDDE